MLKIVYPNCCGIDVHKTFIVAVIAITDNHGITSYHRKLLVAIYQVLLKKENYNPILQGLTEIRNPDKTMSVQDAIRFAQQHGFNVS